MQIELEILNTDKVSIYGGMEVRYRTSFSISNQWATIKWIFTFTRDGLTWIAKIIEINSIEEQTCENVFIMDNEQLSDILDEKLN